MTEIIRRALTRREGLGYFGAAALAACTQATTTASTAAPSIKPEWRQIFEDLPDRFLFGLDLGTEAERTKTIDELVRYYRAIFGQLRSATAEKIAVLNAMRLFRKN